MSVQYGTDIWTLKNKLGEYRRSLYVLPKFNKVW